MNAFALFGFAFGVIATIASVLILMPFRMQNIRAGGPIKALALGAFCLPLIGLMILTATTGSPLSPAATANANASMPAADASNNDNNLPLLAHMSLGQAPQGSVDGTTATARAGHSIAELKAMSKDDPDNARIWLALANAQRQTRDYAAASSSFDKALRLDGSNADAWADYADALASAGNRRLSGAPADAIARALRLDARHPKALWLQASLDLEQHRYSEALQHWLALRAVLPSGSPDINIVEANISEARQLVAQSKPGN